MFCFLQLEQVYGEVFRVLKPGSHFVTYEWVSTSKFDPKNPDHVRIIDEINFGNGLPVSHLLCLLCIAVLVMSDRCHCCVLVCFFHVRCRSSSHQQWACLASRTWLTGLMRRAHAPSSTPGRIGCAISVQAATWG